MRQFSVPAQVETGVEFHQVLVARLGLGQQNHRRGRLGALSRRGFCDPQIDLTSDDRLYARTAGGDREFERGKQVVCVGQGNCRHGAIHAQARQFLEPHRAFQQRIFGMHTQVNESGISHGYTICCCAGRRKRFRKRFDAFSKRHRNWLAEWISFD